MGEKKKHERIVSRQEQAASMRTAMTAQRAREKYLVKNPPVEPKPIEDIVVIPRIDKAAVGVGKYEVEVVNDKGEKVSTIHRGGRKEAEGEIRSIKGKMKAGWKIFMRWMGKTSGGAQKGMMKEVGVGSNTQPPDPSNLKDA